MDTSSWVVVTPPTGNPAIERYEVQIKGGTPAQSCRVTPVTGQPLKCQLTGLEHSKEYVVEVKACVPGPSGCGAVKEGNFRTRPLRELKREDIVQMRLIQLISKRFGCFRAG